MHRDDREREGGADSVRAEQRFEASSLVAAEEPVQRVRVLTNMIVDVDEHFGTGLAGGDKRSRRDRDAISDARDLDEQLAAR